MKRILFAFVLLLLASSVQLSAETLQLSKGDSALVELSDSLKTIVARDTANTKSNGIKPLAPVYEFLSTTKFIWAAIILAMTYFGIKITINLISFLAEKSTRYRITLKGLIPLVRILSWVISITIIIVGIFSPSIPTVVAFSASIGVAVGFASQDILKNIFGGVMIIFDQPFKVGDKIEIGKYYGEVTEIGLRSTRIVTADDSLVSVPNAEVMNQSVSNSNAGEANCQVVAEFYLPLEINTEKVRKIAIEGAQVSRYVYLKKPIVALFFQEMEGRRSYIKMRLKAYVMDIRFEFAFKSDMTELVLKALIEEGIVKSEDYF
ncbi:MAG: mechanosensitive ion channel [Cyclobacteriaceae bacterium]|nr:mechanosensitive ion channel [Cyclobacteriaceae bacterium]